MTSLDPQSNYLVTAQLLTRVHFLLLREFSIQLILLCKLKCGVCLILRNNIQLNGQVTGTSEK